MTMSLSFNLKVEMLKLIHEDQDINKALGNLVSFKTVHFKCIAVECLVNNVLDKVLENDKFLDVAMRKIGSRMQQEQVSPLYVF